ncbi:V-type proton ATPase subunit G 3 [Tupaia chinensis]|uniref:V-type proton ATPase subunit G n=1 Tax=Tupaia chinensis TaxID=246437 RepID=L9K5F7_TUPCH|nr:V-type proton ATPase subunit G 3 [Tupaia chinensis]ELW57888.1 V-type proton ATPase subunit G 3 [Tupaia chinensis]
MASQSQGIHQLLQAEKRAKDKVEEAKKRKGKRSRQAKEEAMAETDQFRIQREKEFRMRQSKVMGSQSHLAEEIEEHTAGKMQGLKGSYSMGMDSVITRLLGMVCDIKPEIHVNYRAAN